MLRAILVTASCAGLLGLVHPAVADVYRYVDAQGRVQYTDKPPSVPAQRVQTTKPTDEAEVAARMAAERQRQAGGDATRQQTQTAATDQRAAQELSATAKAELCTKARERYDRYLVSQRLFEELPDGQRRYLTDEELTTARTAAKTAMDAACN